MNIAIVHTFFLLNQCSIRFSFLEITEIKCVIIVYENDICDNFHFQLARFYKNILIRKNIVF